MKVDSSRHSLLLHSLLSYTSACIEITFKMIWFILGVTLCGLPLSECEDYSTRVVGGRPTTIEQFPFLAQMLMDTWGDGHFSQICAASILTTRHLLSAAHCYQYNNDTGRDYSMASFWNVRVGSSYRAYGGLLSGVQMIIVHPDFNRTLYNNDVAIIHLPTHLQLGPSVRQATIPEENWEIPDNEVTVLLGWGALVTEGPASEQLMSVSMKSVNQAECQTRYSTISASITDSMMCAGLVDVGGADGCHGDSGGPLMYNGVLVGIVSFGYACGHAYYPGVYTKVSHFTSWIVYTVNTN